RPAAGAPLPPPLRRSNAAAVPASAGCRRNQRSTLDVLLRKMGRHRSAEVQLEAREPTLDWQRFAQGFRLIEENVERVVQGKQAEIRLGLAALVAEGHIPDLASP